MTDPQNPTSEGPVNRLETLTSPEAIGAAVLVLMFSAGPLLVGMSILGFVGVCVIGLCLLAGALVSGNHLLAVLTLTYAGILVWITHAEMETSWLVLPAVVVLLLVLSDLLRVAFVRRRGAVVSDQLLVGPVIGSLAAGVVALLSAGLVWGIGEVGSGGSWLWTPVAVGLFMVFVALVVLMPRRGATEADKRRWTPGEQLPPGPRRR